MERHPREFCITMDGTKRRRRLVYPQDQGCLETESVILSQTARPANPRGASRRMASNLNGGPGRARVQTRSFVLVSLDQLVGAEQEGTGAGSPWASLRPDASGGC